MFERLVYERLAMAFGTVAPSRPLLRFGSTGPAVRLLQNALNLAKSLLAPLTTDGQFGAKTLARVREFQQNETLAPDGLVGPRTHGALAQWYDKVDDAVALVLPIEEEGARRRIVQVAEGRLGMWGWPPGTPPPPQPLSPKIAGSFCADESTRARQGGLALSLIFQMAGHGQASQCLTISKEAVAMYRRTHTAQERNDTDLVSWCGLFCLAIHRWAGLRMSPWPLRIRELLAPPQPGELPKIAEWRGTTKADLRPGDVGLLSPINKGRNPHPHHFLVRRIEGNTIHAIDGNAGPVQSIVERTYTYQGTDASGFALIATPSHGVEKCAFITPIWEQVLVGTGLS